MNQTDREALSDPVIRGAELPDAGRIEDAIETADLAFWGTVADAFPEVTSGDVDPLDHHQREQDNKRAVSNWLTNNWPMVELKMGMRVVFPTGTDSHYPALVVEAGETGTVVICEPELVRVKLDTHHDDIEDWDGCYQWSDDEVRDELPTDLVPLRRRTVQILVETDDDLPGSDLIERLEDEPGVKVIGLDGVTRR